MAFGLDYVSGPPISDMKAASVTFVCRYIGYTDPQLSQIKILTPDEARTLIAADISPVSNWEWYANRALAGYTAGVWDAQEAQKRHIACGGPPDRPIYFSVDVDVTGNQVAAYFQSIASVIGLARTGAYGSYRVLKYLFDNNLIRWGWQTYAWSRGQWEPRAHIQQYANGMTLAGHSVDYDRSIKPDFGQWRIGGTMGVPTGWHDDGKTLTAPNSVPVRYGFREYVLIHNWDANNWPLGPEFATGRLEDSNPSLGGGSQQIFRWSMLGYNTTRGVFFEWIGQELIVARQQVAKYYPSYQELPKVQGEFEAANGQVTSLTEQVAALEKQLQAVVGIPTEVVQTRMAAIEQKVTEEADVLKHGADVLTGIYQLATSPFS